MTRIGTWQRRAQSWRRSMTIRKKARQSRQKRIAKAVDRSAMDGRSLRCTGRTAQFNFKALPELKPAAQKAAGKAGLTLAEWMEEAVTAKLREGGIDA